MLTSRRRRGAYYGIIGGVWAIASSLGPIIGGVFTEVRISHALKGYRIANSTTESQLALV